MDVIHEDCCDICGSLDCKCYGVCGCKAYYHECAKYGGYCENCGYHEYEDKLDNVECGECGDKVGREGGER